MKRLFFLLLSLTVIYFSSCKKDDTTTPNGDIIDTWKVVEQSPTFGTQNYHVDISKDTSTTGGIIIDNFFNLGLGHYVSAVQNGMTLTVSNEVLDGYTFNGSGNIASNYNSISWNFTVDDGNGPENATATFTRL